MRSDLRQSLDASPSPARFWAPEPGAPALLAWWLPLLRAARRALDEQVPWLVVPDEWELCGRFPRKGRPDVWVYRHHRSRGELLVDDSGRCYRFAASAGGRSPGRFLEIGIRSAVWRSGLPDVGVAVWWDCPPERPRKPRGPARRRPTLYLVR